MKVILFGNQAAELIPICDHFPEIAIVEDAPEIVICYGGDGTLLTAEQKWPGIPKVPIRNSRRGHRCLGHPAESVISRLTEGHLVRSEFMKISCTVLHQDQETPVYEATAMNEINVHMGQINSAVRFTMQIDDIPYDDGCEILGDGFVISTPFGSTAYFSHITRCFFHQGIGVAFQNTTEYINHLVLPDSATVTMSIRRGPATLAHDNAPNFFPISEGHRIIARRHPEPAVMLTWASATHPSDQF